MTDPAHLKILIVSTKIEFGDAPSRNSFAEHFFELPMRKIAGKVLFFDFISVLRTHGRAAMNAQLLAFVKREKPTHTLFVLRTDEFTPEAVDDIGKYTSTIGYFFDDVWRREYADFWARHFEIAITTDVNGEHLWSSLGHKNFIYMPFAANGDVYKREQMEKQYDITFVGQYHPYRAWIIRRLRHAGLNVSVWGPGWDSSYLDLPNVVRIFNCTRINLNLSNNESFDIRYLASLSRSPVETARVWRRTARALYSGDVKVFEQVKARHFEINSCGAFQLSYFVEGLEKHFDLRSEIAIYNGLEDLIAKCSYYLANSDEREAIAARGHIRASSQHTSELRFQALFDSLHERE
jgi:spore maturation protein CgeB